MKKLYAKISHGDYGSFIETLDNIGDAIDGEFDDINEFAKLGQKWTIEIIEMEEEDFNNLEEFQRW
jgi:hypothetical protein